MALKKKDRGYQIAANIIMALWTLFIILPFLLLLMSSLTDESALLTEGYGFFPSKFSLEAYSYIFRSGDKILSAYGHTILYTVVGTFVNVLITALFAYPLSLKNLPWRKAWNFYVFFTMLFSGGLIPSYMMWTGTFHIKDTIWAQIIPTLLMSAMNVLLVRTYFATSIPDALFEAAQIDGASQMRIFRSIVIPLGKPILVTIGTFSGLAYWNDWNNGLYYITQATNLYGIQNLLNRMVSDLQFLSNNASGMSSDAMQTLARTPTTGVQMAIAFVSILPILILFPFLQKYYSKGISLGAVK